MFSAQEQIDYLNDKIRVNCNILKVQINEFNITKKFLEKNIKKLIDKKDNILKIHFAEDNYKNNKTKNENENNNTIKDIDNGISNIQKDDNEFNKDEKTISGNISNDNSFMK